MKRTRAIALAAIVLTATACADQPTTSSGPPPNSLVTVTEVVDGDTIHVLLAGQTERLRLIGVDAPELEHPPEPAECFGGESASFTQSSLAGERVELEFDVERRDRFGRLLAYVFHRGRLFNKLLVAQGFAIERSYPPNLAHQDDLRAAEDEARMNRRGLWGACERPE